MSSFAKAAVLTGSILLVAILSWEFLLRSHGVAISYDDDAALWSDKRAMIYEDPATSTVFIGASRHKFDLDISTWEAATHDHAIQLAMQGTCALPILDEIAADKKFHGKLIIDITEGLFFSTAAGNRDEPIENISYYRKRTPAQQFSFIVNHALESQFVFLDKDFFSLNAMLDHVKLPVRAGVMEMPDFPREFGPTTFDRQKKMTDKFIADTMLQNRVKGIWAFFRSLSKEPPVSGAKLDSILATIKLDCDQIRSRGGQIMFVRTPSSGPFRVGEGMAFPREKYWKRILEVTGCPGIHFEDYPAISHFQCPEFSHLKPADAIIYTTNLVEILQEKGWKFPNKP